MSDEVELDGLADGELRPVARVRTEDGVEAELVEDELWVELEDTGADDARDRPAGGRRGDGPRHQLGGPLRRRGRPCGPTGPGSYSVNPFDWPTHNQGSAQDTGVAEAWRALELAGRGAARTKVAALDKGFAVDRDIVADAEFRRSSPAEAWATPAPTGTGRSSPGRRS